MKALSWLENQKLLFGLHSASGRFSVAFAQMMRRNIAPAKLKMSIGGESEKRINSSTEMEIKRKKGDETV